MKVNYNIQKEERKAMLGIVGKVLETGFMSEDSENEASCTDTGADEPIQTGVANDSAEVASTEDESTTTETSAEVIAMEEAVAATDEDSLSISLPRTLFTETALQNLDALLLSKGRLIRHAFDIREATYTLTNYQDRKSVV